MYRGAGNPGSHRHRRGRGHQMWRRACAPSRLPCKPRELRLEPKPTPALVPAHRGCRHDHTDPVRCRERERERVSSRYYGAARTGVPTWLFLPHVNAAPRSVTAMEWEAPQATETTVKLIHISPSCHAQTVSDAVRSVTCHPCLLPCKGWYTGGQRAVSGIAQAKAAIHAVAPSIHRPICQHNQSVP